MEKKPEKSIKPEVKKQTELSNSGELPTVSVNYSLRMCIEDQSAGVEFGVTVPCVNGGNEGYLAAQQICEEILPEKLKEVQLLACHLKNTKNKIISGDLDPLAKVKKDD